VDMNISPDYLTSYGPDARHLRIAVVSEVRFLREGVAEIFGRDPSVAVVGLYSDLVEAVLNLALRPDIVLLDAALPDGPAAVLRLHDVAPDVRIIAFAVRETEEDVIAWARAGVIGYVPSTAAWVDLVRLVIEIHAGEQLCSSRVAAGLLRRIAVTESFGSGHDMPAPATALTARERQAAELIGAGLSDKEIARKLNISVATTKSHVHNLLGKLNVQRRGQVVARLGLYARYYDRRDFANTQYPLSNKLAEWTAIFFGLSTAAALLV
jgi:DNA-binding NarL/FixJ family response regulator